jgi:hypothetical protein
MEVGRNEFIKPPELVRVPANSVVELTPPHQKEAAKLGKSEITFNHRDGRMQKVSVARMIVHRN